MLPMSGMSTGPPGASPEKMYREPFGVAVADPRRRLVHAADDGELVGHPRGLRQQLGEPEAGHDGVDRLERAPVLGDGLGLGVEGVHLRHPALLEDHQDVLRLRPARPALPSAAIARPGSNAEAAPSIPSWRKLRRGIRSWRCPIMRSLHGRAGWRVWALAGGRAFAPLVGRSIESIPFLIKIQGKNPSSPRSSSWPARISKEVQRSRDHVAISLTRENDTTPWFAGGCHRLSGSFSGGGGIRTHGTLAGTPVFETGPFGHSGTPPRVQSNVRTAGREEFREQRAAFLGQNTSRLSDPVIQPRIVDQSIEAPAGSGFGVERPRRRVDPSGSGRSRPAHIGTRFQGHIERAAIESPPAEGSTREGQGHAFRVGGRVIQGFPQVVGLRDDLAAGDARPRRREPRRSPMPPGPVPGLASSSRRLASRVRRGIERGRA